MEPQIVIISILTSKMTLADLRRLIWMKNVRNESVMLKIAILYAFLSGFMINHIEKSLFVMHYTLQHWLKHLIITIFILSTRNLLRLRCLTGMRHVTYGLRDITFFKCGIIYVKLKRIFNIWTNSVWTNFLFKKIHSKNMWSYPSSNIW